MDVYLVWTVREGVEVFVLVLVLFMRFALIVSVVFIIFIIRSNRHCCIMRRLEGDGDAPRARPDAHSGRFIWFLGVCWLGRDGYRDTAGSCSER